MAPSSDPNDSPSAMDYWIVDRHVDNKRDPHANDGLLYEMSLAAPPLAPAQRTLTVQVQGTGAGDGHRPGDQLPRRLHRDLHRRPAGHPGRHPGRRLELRRLGRRLLGDRACQLTMDADKQATATFNPLRPPRTLTVQVQPAPAPARSPARGSTAPATAPRPTPTASRSPSTADPGRRLELRRLGRRLLGQPAPAS